jgi:prevent-host-death family protein
MALSEAKMKFWVLVEKVKNTDEEILVAKNGAPAAVLMSPWKLERWKSPARIVSNSSEQPQCHSHDISVSFASRGGGMRKACRDSPVNRPADRQTGIITKKISRVPGWRQGKIFY